MKLSERVSKFFREVESRRVEIYNEFSLQHELGMYLRSEIASDLKGRRTAAVHLRYDR